MVVGSQAVRTLTLQNTSPVAIELEPNAPASFEAPAHVRLEGGASGEVAVTFRPTALGTATGALLGVSSPLATILWLGGDVQSR